MKPTTKFDYIIVGGGSAGCVIANRLSANPEIKVALVEAGPPDNNIFIRIPLGILFAIRNKKINWKYWTVPQKNCAGRSIYWPRGKTLGGSSAINAMCYVRGNPHDYDAWSALGCKGWSYKEVFPYFKKIENFELGESEYHGVAGPLHVSKYVYLNPLMNAFVEAGVQAGYPLNEDCNAKAQEGIGYCFVTEHEGRRTSNAYCYLRPIKNRYNLTIITNTYVSKILFSGKKAIGVQCISGKHSFDLFAEREVILSAGAIGSPQLLMLSGVGSQAELIKHGIPIVHVLEGVGRNLQDHLDIHITTIDKSKKAVSFQLNYLRRFFIAIYEYFFKGRGELTSNYTQAVGFAKTNETLSIPDIHWHFAASVFTNSALNLKNLFKYYGYTLMVCHLHPKSRGRITLRDTNPMSQPLIDPNYLAYESDLDALLIGFKKSREILAQKAFDPYRLKELEPGSQVQTDDEIKAYIRKYSETIYHPVGTCKMGIDNQAVVDPQSLKIYGLQNIRVIDASIMPMLPTGNTNAPTTMIAEKGADFILADNPKKPNF